MSRVLLTGASGFVGTALAAGIAGRVDLFCVSRGDTATDCPPVAEVIQADLAVRGFSRELPKSIDTVIHLAVAPPSLNPSPEAMLDINVMATLELLEYARRICAKRFIYASTGSVYGPGNGALTECSSIAPDGLLGISKYTAELLLRTYAASFSGIVLRLFYVYGQHQSTNFLVSRLASKVTARQPITVGRDDGPRISVTYLADVVRVFEAVMHLDDSVTLNVAHPDPTSILELAKLLGERLGMAPRIERQDGPCRDLVADVSALERWLGWVPQTPLVEGLAHAYPA